MEKLTNKEEELMKILWDLEKAFVKEIASKMSNPKPHYNTLSTVIRKLEDKGYVNHETFGNTHRYYPIIKKAEYRKKFMSNAIESYFENSYKNVVSFFAKNEKISIEELKEVIEQIEKNKKN
ncbi:BlaI/MecI/CopY family transcriptional regulator [Cellulophaga baltica]|uniref:BlaI/MecI/CopY family transcriptional regulator n=1 Tax=Cellulophaga TaxID=104264 RepID=UPI001C06728A|nr:MULTISPECIES: BlaI/MecI/CopY family transcriptional regulator [Cellulophaga]MBU2995882.1 BlaI/MecI/CopY family transcriptional regulator [Cellulophaga baltica]MDO6767277.1 BlaI/MecI/CopY family transcriptional regulator [Cellulophaga sp. 1_MG-2023]